MAPQHDKQMYQQQHYQGHRQQHQRQQQQQQQQHHHLQQQKQQQQRRRQQQQQQQQQPRLRQRHVEQQQRHEQEQDEDSQGSEGSVGRRYLSSLVPKPRRFLSDLLECSNASLASDSLTAAAPAAETPASANASAAAQAPSSLGEGGQGHAQQQQQQQQQHEAQRRVSLSPLPPMDFICDGRPGTYNASQLLTWRPKPDRFLVATCIIGRLSNQLTCLMKYLYFAALLNRTLVVPHLAVANRRPDNWLWSTAVHLPHMQRCLLNAGYSGGSSRTRSNSSCSNSSCISISSSVRNNRSSSSGNISSSTSSSSSSNSTSINGSLGVGSSGIGGVDDVGTWGPSVLSLGEFLHRHSHRHVQRFVCFNTAMRYCWNEKMGPRLISQIKRLRFPPNISRSLFLGPGGGSGGGRAEEEEDSRGVGFVPTVEEFLSVYGPDAIDDPVLSLGDLFKAQLRWDGEPEAPHWRKRERLRLPLCTYDGCGSAACGQTEVAVRESGGGGGVGLSGLEDGGVSEGGSSIRGGRVGSCRNLWRPHEAVTQFAEAAVAALIGAPYFGVHLRRHDILVLCAPNCASLAHLASQIADRALRANLWDVFIATDGTQEEVTVLQKHVLDVFRRRGGATARLHTVASLLAAAKARQWADGASREHQAGLDRSLGAFEGLLRREEAVAMSLADRWLCTLATVFVGNKWSTFTGEIRRVRAVEGRLTCADGYLDYVATS